MQKPKPFLLFYLLAGYIFFQFAWWAYHIVDLNAEIYELKAVIEELSTEDLIERDLNLNSLKEKLENRKLMVLGEGAVFLVLLSLGLYFTNRTFMKEVRLSNQQKNFLLSITHELKSPLASIRLYLQTLQKRKLEPKKEEAVLEKSIAETNRLEKLVDNILIAANIESGSFPFHMEKFNISDLVNEVMNRLDSYYNSISNSENPIQLVRMIEEDLTVLGDKDAISSVVVNLVENAVKYSGNQGEVVIKLNLSNDVIALIVEDKGAGLATEEMSRIFDKFYRVENENTRRTKGTGLGLFIVKYIVENHKGHISVKHNKPNGCIFEASFLRYVEN